MLTLALAVRLAVAPAVDVQQRGPACEGASLAERVATLLEGSSQPVEAGPSIEATLEERDERWTLELRFEGQPAPRHFEARRCDTVLDAAAFVIAVAVDPTVAERVVPPAEDPEAPPKEEDEPPEPTDPPPEPEPEPTDPPPRPADVEPDPAPASAPSSEPRRPPSSLARAAAIVAGVDGSALPVGADVGGRIGLLGPRWRADLRGHYRTASAVQASLDSAVGGRIGGWALGLRGCARLGPATIPLELPLCGSAEAGQVLAEGFGFDGALSARLPWTAVMGETGLVWVFGSRIAVGLETQLGVGLLGGRLVIDGLEQLFEVGRFVGRGLLSVELRLPARGVK